MIVFIVRLHVMQRMVLLSVCVRLSVSQTREL